MEKIVSLPVLVIFRVEGKEFIDVVLRNPNLSVDKQLDEVCRKNNTIPSNYYGFEYSLKLS